jgi:outer membrane protein assembly factor BamB
MVIVQGGGKALIVAYDKHNGNLLWKSMSGEAGYAFAIPIKIENENKLLVYHGTGLSCIEPTNGKELWRSPWATEYNVNATTPIVDSNIIFHSSGYGMGCEAIKFTKNSFTVLYKNNVMEAQHTDPVLIDGYIYGYSGESSQNKGSLKCIELATGKEMWTSDLAGNGTLTFVDGHLICLDLKGNLYLVKPDPKKFILVGEIKKALENVDHFAWTVPVVANGKLYLRYLQHLICYKLTK